MKVRTMTGSMYSLIFLMVLMVVVCGVCFQMEGIKLKLLPIIISIFVLLFSVIQFIREFRIEYGQKEQADESHPKIQGMNQFAIYLWIICFFAVIYLFGFLIAIPSFMIFYMKSQGTKWILNLILTACVTGFVYFVFEALLRVGLYGGVLFH
mgnify:CR=1 FL=1